MQPNVHSLRQVIVFLQANLIDYFMRYLLISAILLWCATTFYAQRGKAGDVIIANNSIINEYTSLTVNASSGSNSLTVANSSLNANGRFSGNLEPGDLILIIQIQGISINATAPPEIYGAVTNYNNCGNYEYAEVMSVPNATTIQLRCGLRHNYTVSGKVQIIRVPRYNSLTVNAQITADNWNGSVGGLVVIECLNDVIINSSGSINVVGKGFRGGIEDYQPSNFGFWDLVLMSPPEGGVKGESAFGYDADYNAVGGKYCYGAIANGGGGGNSHNAGGGGGGNGGNIANWVDGVGVPNSTYNAAWALESPSIAGNVRSGGGRGGYTYSANNHNPLANGPNNYGLWAGDGRRPVGGLGGRPLDYSTGRLFLGGGGGSGDANQPNSVGGHGGNGGGLILIKSYGTVTGTGTINANGANGVNLTCPSPGFGTFGGNDGAGGAGAGGTVHIEATNGVSNLTVTANGGNGGNQVFVAGSFYFGSFNEAEGPGGGGGGGYIALTNPIGVSTSTLGGNAGTTNSTTMVNFPVNGATNGGEGTATIVNAPFNIIAENDTICSGTSTTLTASVVGTLPSGSSLLWYDSPFGNFIGAGTNFTTNNLFNDTTFYVSVCPGDYVVPVSVIMGVSFSIDVSNLTLNNENCGQADGSIEGIAILGGAAPITYEWNGIVQGSADLTGLSAGNYSLFVADGNGCGTTIGPFTLNENTGPTIDIQNVIISEAHCGQATGAISGVSVTGTAPFTYSLNGTSVTNLDVGNLAAGDYTYLVSDAFGCNTTSGIIAINEAAPITLDLSQAVLNPASCNQATGSISGITIINGAAPFTYNLNGNVVNDIDVNMLLAGDYVLTVEDAYGCTVSSNNLTITEADPMLIDSSQVNITPATCNLPNGSITGLTVINGLSPYTYSWSNSSLTSINLSNVNSGSYVLTVTDSVGCSVLSLPFVVQQTGLPTSNFTLTPQPIHIGDTLIITNAASSDIVTWSYTLDGVIIDTTTNTSILIANRGMYTLCQIVTNGYGCQDSTCQLISVNELPVEVTLPLPNILTVNNDGQNDFFAIEGNIGNHSITIFNRWGQVVFDANPYLNNWDGRNEGGKELPEGTYYFLLQSIEDANKSYTGFVTLIR
jgi:gliding motility-associated-like protein